MARSLRTATSIDNAAESILQHNCNQLTRSAFGQAYVPQTRGPAVMVYELSCVPAHGKGGTPSTQAVRRRHRAQSKGR